MMEICGSGEPCSRWSMCSWVSTRSWEGSSMLSHSVGTVASAAQSHIEAGSGSSAASELAA